MPIVPPKSRFQRSAQTQWLIDRLRVLPIEGFVSYEELSKIIGDKVQEKRWVLDSARKTLRDEDSMLFAPVSDGKDHGLRRMDDSHMVEALGKRVQRVHRSSQIGRKEAGCVRVDSVPPEQRIQFVARQSIFGLIEVTTSKRKQRTIESRVEPTKLQLDMSEIVKALEGKNGKEDE